MSTSRRTRRSAQQWAVIVEEYLASDLSETEFCESRDLAVGTLRKWRYRSSTDQDKPPRQAGQRNFTPIAVNPSDMTTVMNSVSIELGGDIKISCTTLSLESIAKLALAVRHGH